MADSIATFLTQWNPSGSTVQFLRPLWLLAIPLLWLVAWRMLRQAGGDGWGRYIDADKLTHLIIGQADTTRWWSAAVVAGFTLALLAMAGPSWQQLPLTTLKNRQAMVILFDLSPSMLAWDLRPSRLEQAKLKLIDLLHQRRDGDIALIAYAANAYRVSPLTDDMRTITTLVPTLHPSIMPAPGSQTEEAIQLALTLFKGAGLTQGDLLLITDGVSADAVAAIKQLLPTEFRLSVLAVGHAEGSPFPAPAGGMLRDKNGQVVIAHVDHAALAALADSHHGRYAALSIDQQDVQHLSSIRAQPVQASSKHAAAFDTHVDGGWWLVLLLLPLVASAFRRNTLWVVTFALLSPLSPLASVTPLTAKPAHAWDWDQLWLNRDQRAAKALATGNAKFAAQLFRSQPWAGVAHIRAGNPVAAAAQFAAGRRADDHYNRATSLAIAGQFQQALDAYDAALRLQPDHADARYNRALIEQVRKQRRDQQQDASQRKKRQQRAAKTNEPEQAPPGQQANNPRGQQQAATVGGTASEGQTEGQQAIDQQSGQTTPSKVNQARQADPNRAPPGGRERTRTARNESALPANETPSARNDLLNPYSEQWLRNLPSDPGALMRRKFRYQATVRGVAGGGSHAADGPSSAPARY